MFDVGSRVVCVDDSMQPHTVEELKKDVPNWVKKGQRYTIRDIVDHDFVVGVRLEEISNAPIYFKIISRAIEPCFASWRFRALQEDEVEAEVEAFEEVY
jgi:hypothetical protein